MIVPDEVVIEALLKDARRFKSKWELNVSEPTRSKPNTKFLKRTISDVVKTNQDRMRRPRRADSYERDLKSQSFSPDRKRTISPGASSHSSDKGKRSRTPEDADLDKKHRRKSCSKSKHRSPSSRRRSSKSGKKTKRDKHKSGRDS